MVLLNLVATWSLPFAPTHPDAPGAPLAKNLESPTRAWTICSEYWEPRDTLGTLGAAKTSRDTFGTLGTPQTLSWALCSLW